MPVIAPRTMLEQGTIQAESESWSKNTTVKAQTTCASECAQGGEIHKLGMRMESPSVQLLKRAITLAARNFRWETYSINLG